MPDPPRVSVVVPVYNGAETLAELAARTDRALDGTPHELILVNDGSADESWRRIEGLAAQSAVVRGLDLTRNFGQHNALLAGVRAASGEIVVTLDDDLQNPPEEIPRLLEKLEEGFDVVYGTTPERRHARWRNLGAWLVRTGLRGSVGKEIAGSVGPFRAFRTELREAFATFAGPYVSLDVLLSWATTRFAAVPVRHDERAAGTSTYSLRKLAGLALTMLTGFSTRPLRIASLLGFASFAFGMLVLAFVLVRYALQGSPVPGFPFLASLIAIFSGIQLLTLGIIGEYLGRVHVRSMAQPAYVVREAVGETLAQPEPSSDA